MIVKPSAEGIAASVQAATKKGPPPVHLWNPPFCGDIDMRIARDGTWFYQGSPIGRAGLVRLFSSILRREGGRYYLVTPVEKVGIVVDDVPFVAQDFDVTAAGTDEQTLEFTTHVGDQVIAGPDHPIRAEPGPTKGEVIPYILIRADLWARIDRKSFYRMANLGCHETVAGKGWFGVRSSGRFFGMIPSSDMEDSET